MHIHMEIFMSSTLEEEDFAEAAARIGCNVAAVKAVTEVESRGGGFDPEGDPKTLFEGHWFHKYTKGIYSKDYPHLSYAKWTRKFYGKSWIQEKQRLNEAIELDEEAALKSASWGMFQIMGGNYEDCGFDNVFDFVAAMRDSEAAQLDAFVSFILARDLDHALIKRDWAAFAYRYNGPGYKTNKYDEKLAAAYKRASA
jgi:hypothetical protein